MFTLDMKVESRVRFITFLASTADVIAFIETNAAGPLLNFLTRIGNRVHERLDIERLEKFRN